MSVKQSERADANGFPARETYGDTHAAFLLLMAMIFSLRSVGCEPVESLILSEITLCGPEAILGIVTCKIEILTAYEVRQKT
jgi:hypothetical protein